MRTFARSKTRRTIQECPKILDGSPDLLRDLRVQFKTLLMGIKTTLFNLKNSGLSEPDHSENIQYTTYTEEVDIYKGIFVNGLACFE